MMDVVIAGSGLYEAILHTYIGQANHWTLLNMVAMYMYTEKQSPIL